MEAVMLNGDCLEVMKTLPDKSVDLFVCDLPYGCLEPQRKRDPDYVKNVKASLVGQTRCAWDVPIDLEQFWTQVERLCRDDHTPVLMFCSTKFGFDLYNSKPDWFRYDLVWSKPNAVGFLLANKMPMKSHEMIYVFAKKGARYIRKDVEGDFPAGGGGNRQNAQFIVAECPPHKTEAGRRCVKSVVEVSNKKGKGNHPTQKPVELYRWLIERYSKEGDTVLDPTAGSFASVFTAVDLNRKGIGIEKDKAFYEKAVSSLAVS
jgi:site-specific DNA-methyltransferase (adenine-specific)